MKRILISLLLATPGVVFGGEAALSSADLDAALARIAAKRGEQAPAMTDPKALKILLDRLIREGEKIENDTGKALAISQTPKDSGTFYELLAPYEDMDPGQPRGAAEAGFPIDNAVIRVRYTELIVQRTVRTPTKAIRGRSDVRARAFSVATIRVGFDGTVRDIQLTEGVESYDKNGESSLIGVPRLSSPGPSSAVGMKLWAETVKDLMTVHRSFWL